jgi:hypothetical protein
MEPRKDELKATIRARRSRLDRSVVALDRRFSQFSEVPEQIEHVALAGRNVLRIIAIVTVFGAFAIVLTHTLRHRPSRR